ncbi:hypothetical protein KUCAC02_030475 [Chaenocephalus aceratus]|uniref:Uncharacterized protein n=1 Tax=Chaenocephalus aceratus TaxID=36190 RepID=A0ACB9XJL7_CHAAC|nr:hypothetical protein KUCAC02_030475 [Chaenocephalus aceratus]
MIPQPMEEYVLAFHFLPALPSVMQMPGSSRPCGNLTVDHSEQILIHSGRDLSLSVVFADLPLALFSASGRKRFPLLGKNMNGSFVVTFA